MDNHKLIVEKLEQFKQGAADWHFEERGDRLEEELQQLLTSDEHFDLFVERAMVKKNGHRIIEFYKVINQLIFKYRNGERNFKPTFI